MRDLNTDEIEAVSGGGFFAGIAGCLGAGVTVIWDAVMNGTPPGGSSMTGTASGPTPGGVGGRYRIEDMNKERSYDNMPGGEGSEALGKSLNGD